jgi:hypothetical protein
MIHFFKYRSSRRAWNVPIWILRSKLTINCSLLPFLVQAEHIQGRRIVAVCLSRARNSKIADSIFSKFGINPLKTKRICFI